VSCRRAAAIAVGCAIAGTALPQAAAAQPGPLLPAPKPEASGSAAPAPGTTQPPPPNAPGPALRISDERTRTYRAYVRRRSAVRAQPGARERRVGSIKRFTYYGLRDVVLVLREELVAGRLWSLIRYSGLGVRKGWVLATALGRPRLLTTQLVITRRRPTVRLYRAGRLVFRARAGVGAARSPTPKGRFFVRERLRPAKKNTVYGVLAFGLSAYSRFRTDWPGGGQVGLHGTNQPRLIPGRISNGCIRLRNRHVLRLDRLMPIGTPILIK
jgi:hypothetical protein